MLRWFWVGATASIFLSLLTTLGDVSPARAYPTATTSADANQPREDLWFDVSRSASRQAVRLQYLKRAEEIIEDAIGRDAYLRVLLFEGAASHAVPIIDRSLHVSGPNSSYLAGAKRKLREDLMKTLAQSLRSHIASDQFIRGSDPAGAVRYGVAAVKAGIAPSTSAAVWVFSDGEQTFRSTYLVRLLWHQAPRAVVNKWLRPYLPNARGVDLHFRGLGQGTLASASTRLSIRIEQVWRQFCLLSKARSCDVSAEV
jgi:hypothetical protein